MSAEMLSSLFFPLLFSLFGGVFAYFHVPEKSGQVLSVMVLFQLVGALGNHLGSSPTLFGVLLLHAVGITALIVHRAQRPVPARA